MLARLASGSYRGQCGKHMLAVSSSHRDPTRTFLDRGGQSKRREHCVAHLWLPGPPAVCYRLRRSRVHPGCAGLAHPLSPGSIGLICLNAAVRAGGERQKRVAAADSLARHRRRGHVRGFTGLKNGGFLVHRNHRGVEMSQKSGTAKSSA